MELYYKISKESKTGKAFLEIMKRVNLFDDKEKAFREKYGIRSILHWSYYLRGVSACRFYQKSDTDKKDWKKVEQGYMPRVRCKNKELLKDFEELKSLSIKCSEVDVLFGVANPFYHVGYKIFDDCIVILADDDYDIECDDAEMISNLDFIKLEKNSIKN